MDDWEQLNQHGTLGDAPETWGEPRQLPYGRRATDVPGAQPSPDGQYGRRASDFAMPTAKTTTSRALEWAIFVTLILLFAFGLFWVFKVAPSSSETTQADLEQAVHAQLDTEYANTGWFVGQVDCPSGPFSQDTKVTCKGHVAENVLPVDVTVKTTGSSPQLKFQLLWKVTTRELLEASVRRSQNLEATAPVSCETPDGTFVVGPTTKVTCNVPDKGVVTLSFGINSGTGS